MSLSFTRTLRLKVHPESYGWLNAAAREVNQVYNFCRHTAGDGMSTVNSQEHFAWIWG